MAAIVISSAASAAGASATWATAASAGTATAATTVGLRSGFIDVRCPTAEVFSIQGGDGFLGFRRDGHLNERESSRTAGTTVGDHAHLVHFAMGFKQRAKIRFRCAVGDIADEKLLHNAPLFPLATSKCKCHCLPRC